MRKKWHFGKKGYRRIAAALGILAAALLVGKEMGKAESGGFLEAFSEAAGNEIISFWSPALRFAGRSANDVWWSKSGGGLLLFSFLEKEEPAALQAESGWTREDIIRAEGRDEYSGELASGDLETPADSEGRLNVDDELARLLLEENGAGGGNAGEAGTAGGDGAGESGNAGGSSASGSGTNGSVSSTADNGTNGTGGSTNSDSGTAQDALPGFSDPQIAQYMAAPSEKKQLYQWDFYEKYDALVNEFYAVDASTVVDESQLNLEDLLTPDLSITKRTDSEPQILIYHTHSQEDFADSVKGDPSTTIMGVGQVLAQILEEGYGYNVMHHLGQYDVENRDYAYNTALPVMEQLLAEYPTIEVVIDLHRDEVAEGTKLVTEIEGRPTARFMFFNGLSRTRKHGDIEYLPNENIASNLAFSFQMQALCNEYYPGLTRRVYLKGYRYNMHLKARYLLIEMGAQTNTYQECYNACIPLARMLDLELSGADP